MAKRNKFGVRFLRIAEEDLNEILDYIALDNFRSALKLADSFDKVFARLADHPYLGKIPDEFELANARYRFLVHDDYIIFYKIESENILIHRILHGARDYKNIL